MSDVLQRAADHLRAGRWAQAESHYREVLAADSNSVEALRGLGLVGLRTGRLREAADWFSRALALAGDGEAAGLHDGLATAWRRLGDGERALAHYRIVADLRPTSPTAALNLGAALADAGRYGEAADRLGDALRLAPDLLPAREALATVLNRLGRHVEAEAAYSGTDAPTLRLRSALAIALKEQGRLDAASATFEAVLADAPGDLEARYNLGNVLKDRGRTAQAIACFQSLLAIAPDHAPARLALCMALLPPLCRDEAELRASRQAYAAELGALATWAQARPADALADAVGTSQPFYLAYQGEDDADLQRLYGGLIHRAMSARYPPVPLAEPPRPGERLRVGFVSGFFRDHANWRTPVGGWVRGLDRTRFELLGYHTGALQDPSTSLIAASFDAFVQGPMPTGAWRERIARDRPHVLIFPEVGMDPAAVRLAALRLAPVQCVSWGHPVTSGLPTLDYFLSSDFMEPAAAQGSYTERLVRLPGLSTPIRLPPVPPAAQRPPLGLRRTATVFWCAQSPYKYLPRHDEVFARIAARAGDCQFVFVAFPGSEELTVRFRDRLHRAFADKGLDPARACVILPRLSAEDYRAAMGACDVVLDSLGWSGCNSIVDALACGLPVVTFEGERLRGRHGAALLRAARRKGCVAASLDGYVDLAVDLARRPALRRRLRPPPRTRLAESLNAVSPLPALADFLLAAVEFRRP